MGHRQNRHPAGQQVGVEHLQRPHGQRIAVGHEFGNLHGYIDLHGRHEVAGERIDRPGAIDRPGKTLRDSCWHPRADPREGKRLGQRYGPAVHERMTGAAEHVAAMPAERFAGQFLLIPQIADFCNPQIDRAGQDLAGDLAPPRDMHRDAELRMPGGQAGNGAIARDDARVGTERNLERANFAAGQQPDLAPQILFGGEQQLASFQDHVAERRQNDHPAVPFEERHAQILLQRLDALAERRLRDVQGFGGAPEMAMRGQRVQMEKAAGRDHN